MRKKKLGADLNQQVVDQFNLWADAEKYKRGGATEAALLLFMSIPQEIRRAALLERWDVLQRWFDEAMAAASREALDAAIAEATEEYRSVKAMKKTGRVG